MLIPGYNSVHTKRSTTDTILVNLFDTVGAITLELFPKASLGEIA